MRWGNASVIYYIRHALPFPTKAQVVYSNLSLTGKWEIEVGTCGFESPQLSEDLEAGASASSLRPAITRLLQGATILVVAATIIFY